MAWDVRARGAQGLRRFEVVPQHVIGYGVGEGIEGLEEGELVVVELLLGDGAHVVHAVTVAAPVGDGAHCVQQFDTGAVQAGVGLQGGPEAADGVAVPPDARIINAQRRQRVGPGRQTRGGVGGADGQPLVAERHVVCGGRGPRQDVARVRVDRVREVPDAPVPQNVVVLLFPQLARAGRQLLVVHAVVRNPAGQAQRPVECLHARGVLAHRIVCDPHVEMRVGVPRAVRRHLLVQLHGLAGQALLPKRRGAPVQRLHVRVHHRLERLLRRRGGAALPPRVAPHDARQRQHPPPGHFHFSIPARTAGLIGS